MTDCWINIMPRPVVHSLHLHPLSTISGTYYVRTPRGAPGIKFEDPRLDRFMAAPPRRADCRSEHRPWVTVPAEAGTVVLFESWLRHEVPPNPVAAERVSISFNYQLVLSGRLRRARVRRDDAKPRARRREKICSPRRHPMHTARQFGRAAPDPHAVRLLLQPHDARRREASTSSASWATGT